MKLRVSNDAEAIKFLMEEIYNTDGEFRIHTNRRGIKLYIMTLNAKYSGYKNVFVERRDNENRTSYIHRDCKKVTGDGYEESFEGKTLTEALNKHLEALPGNIIHIDENFDDEIKSGVVKSFNGSLKDFKKFGKRA